MKKPDGTICILVRTVRPNQISRRGRKCSPTFGLHPVESSQFIFQLTHSVYLSQQNFQKVQRASSRQGLLTDPPTTQLSSPSWRIYTGVRRPPTKPSPSRTNGKRRDASTSNSRKDSRLSNRLGDRFFKRGRGRLTTILVLKQLLPLPPIQGLVFLPPISIIICLVNLFYVVIVRRS